MYVLFYCCLLIFCIGLGCTRDTSYSEISAEQAQLHRAFGQLISEGLATSGFDGNITRCQEQLISEEPRALNSMIASNSSFYVNPETNLWCQVVSFWRTNQPPMSAALPHSFSNEAAVCSPVPRIDTLTGSKTFMAVSFADSTLSLTNMPTWAGPQPLNTNRTP